MAKAIIIFEFDLTDDSPMLSNVAYEAAVAAHALAPTEMVNQIRLGIDSTAETVLACFDELDKPEKRYQMGGEA